MDKNKATWPIVLVFGTYIVCYGFRLLEYLLLRTDRTMIGEAFLHKVVGIVILAALLRRLGERWRDIGFGRNTVVRDTLLGLLIGVVSFSIAYSTEIMILQMSGNAPRLSVYISSYSITGNSEMQTGPLFLLVCIVGNIINVVMEEGVFRGLFVSLFERKTSFSVAMCCSSLLFGLWHIAAPLREFLDGNMQPGSLLAACLMQVLLTGVMGIMFCLLVKITGSLWTAMAVHFVNNFIENILHVVTGSGADELLVIRISVAQTLTFLGVLGVFIAKKSHRRATFR